jgi:hypothetical protein
MNESDAPAIGPAPRRQDLVDESSDQSFPASDPPGWSLLHLGAPRQQSDEEKARRTPSTPASTDVSP